MRQRIECVIGNNPERREGQVARGGDFRGDPRFHVHGIGPCCKMQGGFRVFVRRRLPHTGNRAGFCFRQAARKTVGPGRICSEALAVHHDLARDDAISHAQVRRESARNADADDAADRTFDLAVDPAPHDIHTPARDHRYGHRADDACFAGKADNCDDAHKPYATWRELLSVRLR